MCSVFKKLYIWMSRVRRRRRQYSKLDNLDKLDIMEVETDIETITVQLDHLQIDECAICLNPMSNILTLDCDHQFCQTCLDKWYANCIKNGRDMVCPQCV